GRGNSITKVYRDYTKAYRGPAPCRAAAQRPAHNPTQLMATLWPNALFRGDYFSEFEGNSPHGSKNGSSAWRISAV
ncbi:MAG: hypothetical protein ACOWWR_10615, partial [Eubacteriales bacterium]